MSEISLILVLQNKNKQNSEWHGKNTNKIRETHSFWGIFSIMEQFDAFSSNHRFLLGIEMHYVWLSIQRDSTLSLICIEHLLRQQYLCQPVQDRLWLKTMLFWLNQRDSPCTLQTVIFLQATLIIGLRPFGIEDVFIAFLMFGPIRLEKAGWGISRK